MAALLDERSSRAAMFARRLAVFSFVLFGLSAFGLHRRLMDVPEFVILLGLILLLALVALFAVAWGWRRVWRFGDRGGGNVAVAILFSLTVLSPFAVAGVFFLIEPPISDVSTDLDDPPVFVGASPRTGAMNPIRPIAPKEADLQRSAFPDVSGRRYGASIDHVADVARQTMKAEGWRISEGPPLGEDQIEYEIEAVASTPFLPFPSDVVVRLRDEGDSTYVDMRSASRYGRFDLGSNAARIRGFLARLDVAMASEAR
ncbi:MAG: DUF1499 domain-containing protein [Rhizobiaceae bacterium]|nr:MAG: DUF1499 domain-containing protein [Rhizobiaceae bacterium]